MQEDARQMIGFHVITSDDEDLGTVERVYLDNRTQQPEFVSVKSGGLFGRRESLVPLQGSRVSGEQLRLPFDKQKVKDAPDVGNANDISPQEGAQLYEHYGLRGTSVPAQQTGEADRIGDGGRAGDRTDAEADTTDMKVATGSDPRADAGADRPGNDSGTGTGLGTPAAAGIGTAAATGAGTAAVAGMASHHGADAKPDTPDTGTDAKAGTGRDAPNTGDTRMPGAPAAAMVGHTGSEDPAPAAEHLTESPAGTADASAGLGTDATTGHLTSGDSPSGEPEGLSAHGAGPTASGDAPAASAGMATDAEHTAGRTAPPDGLDAGRPTESAGMPGTREAGHAAEDDGESAGGKGAAAAAGGAGVALAAGGAGAAYAAHRAKSPDAGHTPDTADAQASPEAQTAGKTDTAAMAGGPDAEHAEHAGEVTGTEKGPDGMEGTDSGASRTVAIPRQGIRLIREPIAEGEQLTEADHSENVIIVYAERLVVGTERVPVERVRVVKAGDQGGTGTEPSPHTTHDVGSIS